MSGWGEVFLGIIAFATLATAVVQIGVLMAAAKAAKRLDRLTDRIEHELRPLFTHLDSIGRDASRASSLVSAQVERVDGMLADLGQRFDRGLDRVQAAVAAPARESTALLAGARALFGALRDGQRSRPRSRGEDEDALFI